MYCCDVGKWRLRKSVVPLASRKASQKMALEFVYKILIMELR